MRMRSIPGLGAMIASSMMAASPLVVDDWPTDPKPQKPAPPRKAVPNDFGPVIDSTPESKRARRRRLARAGGSNA